MVRICDSPFPGFEAIHNELPLLPVTQEGTDFNSWSPFANLRWREITLSASQPT
jgi:hypothetical protein